ncbi:MAG: FolC bifunctional protein [Verrucomicrobiales bacterium]|nr:FolC bifunctional protein [Verrucomicrobiales bacterium]
MFGTRPGLENAFNLAEAVGSPQARLRFIHVAGTNGKGSTCAFLESIYRAAGLKVGLYTSPHLVSFCERIQVNRRNISETDVAGLVQFIKPFIENRGAHSPTLFEVATIIALKYFAEAQCDIVIWETGLGGRWDATNIVKPLVSVITNIQMDHEQWLGDTLEKIAAEKAGIIKPAVPAITATDEPEALAVLRESARAKGAPLIEVSRSSEVYKKIDKLPLKGPHQKINAALAHATAELLQPLIPVSPEQIATGLSDVNWPGRFQVIPRSKETTIILDGAHNPAGFKALADTLTQEYPLKKITVIAGMLRDKSWMESISLLIPFANRLIAVPVKSDRTLSPTELADFCRKVKPGALQEVLVCTSISSALAIVDGNAVIVVTGSLYLIGEAIEALGLSRLEQREPQLNEWSQTNAPRSQP